MKFTSIASFAVLSAMTIALPINLDLQKRGRFGNIFRKTSGSADTIHPPQSLQETSEGAAPLDVPQSDGRIVDNSPDIQRSPHKHQQLLDLQRL